MCWGTKGGNKGNEIMGQSNQPRSLSLHGPSGIAKKRTEFATPHMALRKGKEKGKSQIKKKNAI